MAQAYTRGDTIGIYQTENGTRTALAFDLGGRRGSRELFPEFFVFAPIPPLNIQAISGWCGEGNAILSAPGINSIAFTKPNGTQGAANVLNNDTTALAEDTDTSAWVRVYRDTLYSADDLGGFCELRMRKHYGHPVAGPDLDSSASVQNYYAAIMLHNHSGLNQDATSVKAWIKTLGTQATSDSAQLGGAGAGTITSSDTAAFADWPASGWCHIKNAGATREIVYYSSRTDDDLTIPADGRGRLGTSAGAGAATDTLDCVPGIRIALEGPDTHGDIQSIASASTSPTGRTWNTGITSATGLSIGTLGYSDNQGIWIHREIPANCEYGLRMESAFKLEYTVDGTTYNNEVRGHYNIGDTSLVQYELYTAVDAAPNLAGAPDDTNSTVSFSHVITPPGAGEETTNFIVLKRNKYNLVSKGIFYNSIEIDSGGNDVTFEVGAPVEQSLANSGGGTLLLKSKYYLDSGTITADSWRAYVTTNGVDPDPAVTTPSDTLFSDTDSSKPNYVDYSQNMILTLGPVAYGTDVRVIMRAYDSVTDTESKNVNVLSATVSTDLPVLPPKQSFGSRVWNFRHFNIQKITENSTDFSNQVSLISAPGITSLFSNTTLIWRVFAAGDLSVIRMDGDWIFDNLAHSAASTESVALNVPSAGNIYVNVNNTRRAFIDVSNKKIEAATFVFGADLGDIRKTDESYMTTTATYFQVYDPTRGYFRPYLKVDSSGVMTLGFPVQQKRS